MFLLQYLSKHIRLEKVLFGEKGKHVTIKCFPVEQKTENKNNTKQKLFKN